MFARWSVDLLTLRRAATGSVLSFALYKRAATRLNPGFGNAWMVRGDSRSSTLEMHIYDRLTLMISKFCTLVISLRQSITVCIVYSDGRICNSPVFIRVLLNSPDDASSRWNGKEPNPRKRHELCKWSVSHEMAGGGARAGDGKPSARMLIIQDWTSRLWTAAILD